MTEPTPAAIYRDLIVDYLRRGPATLSNVVSHFGISQNYALSALLTLHVEGRVSRRNNHRWEVVNGH